MRKIVLIATLAVAAIPLAACNASDVLVQQFEVGQCVTFDVPTTTEETEVGNLPVVSCGEEHEGEVFFVKEIEGDDYPATVGDDAAGVCLEEFEGYVGKVYEESTLDVTYLYPSSQTWTIGDRDIVCLVVPFESPLPLESVKGSGL